MREATRDYLRSAGRMDMDGKKVLYFSDPVSCARELKKIVEQDDLILVKGSQSMRMEKIVEEIMEKQFDARELLCRQSKEWRKKPFVEP
ncbi:MAG: hypothetical protein US15_C0070G0005 [Candidatus Moranbacteria bacterium GW2011_GWF1_36_4]|nr:MAG: hypothetical protein US15_C0070G0005 [Candidatus Moranbacteria bacterium GW2011_GWF1_36_4]